MCNLWFMLIKTRTNKQIKKITFRLFEFKFCKVFIHNIVCPAVVQLVISTDLNKQTKKILRHLDWMLLLLQCIILRMPCFHCSGDLMQFSVMFQRSITFASDTSSTVLEEKSKFYANKANSWHTRTELQNEREKQLRSFDEKWLSS